MVSIMRKITMSAPIVEMDGDEMARVMWGWIKKELLEPFIELYTVYIDLGLKKRDETNDEVTYQAVDALRKYKIGVKCPTITPNKDRMIEYGLRNLLPSPNATLRSRLRGTIFRTPFIVSRIKPLVKNWQKPIVIARHGVGDIYEAIEVEVHSGNKLSVFLGEERIYNKVFESRSAVIMYSISEASIVDFARSVFSYALENGFDVWFSAKDTISKKYDGLYKEIFERVFNDEFKEKFKEKGLSYSYFLIDDAYARVVRSIGGFVWALKNYDGDVASDFVLSSFSGSIALSISELYSPDGVYYSEASHGTIQKHYYRYLRGETPHTNPVGLILAWAKALEKRAILDANNELLLFSRAIPEAIAEVIDVDGYGTPDIAKIADPPLTVVSTLDFIRLVRRKIEKKLF